MDKTRPILSGFILGSFLASSLASADVNRNEGVTSRILFNCNMSFKIEGTSAYLGVGGTSASGKGRLSCYDYLTGAVEDIPLNVSIKGVGLGIGITGFNISGGKVGIGLNARPESLLGSYARVSANAAMGVGGELGGGLRLSFRKASLEISAVLAGRSGLGAGVEIGELHIERDESQRTTITHGHVDSALARSEKRDERKAHKDSVVIAQPQAEELSFDEVQADSSRDLPVENVVLKSQGGEIILVNSKGQPVKKLKVFLLKK